MVGYEWKEPDDVQHVIKYFHANNLLSVSVECVRPNDSFASLDEEMEFFKNLGDTEKAEYISDQTMGPGKMARFILEAAQSLKMPKHKISEGDSREEEVEEETIKQGYLEEGLESEEEQQPIDPKLPMFACRICRSILFGTNHLAEGHIQNLHTFRRSHDNPMQKKAILCQSLFCDESVLGRLALDGSKYDVEGRLKCPKCLNKLGHWNWSGLQCSCGTFVVPAVQIPISKIDTIFPESHEHPSVQFVSPTLLP